MSRLLFLFPSPAGSEGSGPALGAPSATAAVSPPASAASAAGAALSGSGTASTSASAAASRCAGASSASTPSISIFGAGRKIVCFAFLLNFTSAASHLPVLDQTRTLAPLLGLKKTMAADKEQAALKKKLELLLKTPDNLVCADCPSRCAPPVSAPGCRHTRRRWY